MVLLDLDRCSKIRNRFIWRIELVCKVWLIFEVYKLESDACLTVLKSMNLEKFYYS